MTVTIVSNVHVPALRENKLVDFLFIFFSSAGEKPDIDNNPPILFHNSRGRFTSSCNCGRKQAPREDPFDIQAANYDFYQVRSDTQL